MKNLFHTNVSTLNNNLANLTKQIVFWAQTLIFFAHTNSSIRSKTCGASLRKVVSRAGASP